MKTIYNTQFVYLSILAGFLVFSSCSKDESDPNSLVNQSAVEKDVKTTPSPSTQYLNEWRDDFTTASSLSSGWKFYGQPQPQWVYNAFGRWGLFDSNGIDPSGSTAVSKARIGNGQGYVIESEVYIDLQNPNGLSISPGIGVTRYLNLPSDPGSDEAGIVMRLAYLGNGSPYIPVNLQNKFVIQTEALNYDGTFTKSVKNNLVTENIWSDNWHKMKIVVGADQKVTFFMDDQLVFSPAKKVHPSLMKNKNVILGFISSGVAGKSYHDWVKVSYPLPQ